MQVNGPSSLLQILLATQAKRETAVPFAAKPEALPAPVPTGVETPVQSVQMLVALAAMTPERSVERRRRLVKQAERGLDALEMLQAALVIGTNSGEPAAQLRNWAEDRAPLEDPELEGIMDEIDLRIQVELAKLERE
jgi:hypothetical protein